MTTIATSVPAAHHLGDLAPAMVDHVEVDTQSGTTTEDLAGELEQHSLVCRHRGPSAVVGLDPTYRASTRASSAKGLAVTTLVVPPPPQLSSGRARVRPECVRRRSRSAKRLTVVPASSRTRLDRLLGLGDRLLLQQDDLLEEPPGGPRRSWAIACSGLPSSRVGLLGDRALVDSTRSAGTSSRDRNRGFIAAICMAPPRAASWSPSYSTRTPTAGGRSAARLCR
jgi:hypothetical protein